MLEQNFASLYDFFYKFAKIIARQGINSTDK